MNEVWFDEKPNGAIKFEFYSLTDISKLRTNVCQLEVAEISDGKFKGVRYFRPKRETILENRAIELPEDFVFDTFMSLDPYDENGLLDFQNRYGQIVSPLFETVWGDGDASFMLELDPTMKVKKGEIGLTKKLNEYLKGLNPNEDYLYYAVPIIEVTRTVIVMQDLIQATSNLRNDDYTQYDILDGETFNLLANRVAKSDTPVFGFAKDNPNARTNIVGLIDNIVFHHMAALSRDTRKIWKCTHCGKYFQYKKRETIHPTGNHFCSPECSSRHHQSVYDNSKRGQETRRRYKEAKAKEQG